MKVGLKHPTLTGQRGLEGPDGCFVPPGLPGGRELISLVLRQAQSCLLIPVGRTGRAVCCSPCLSFLGFSLLIRLWGKLAARCVQPPLQQHHDGAYKALNKSKPGGLDRRLDLQKINLKPPQALGTKVLFKSRLYWVCKYSSKLGTTPIQHHQRLGWAGCQHTGYFSCWQPEQLWDSFLLQQQKDKQLRAVLRPEPGALSQPVGRDSPCMAFATWTPNGASTPRLFGWLACK